MSAVIKVLKIVQENDTSPIDIWLESIRDKITRARIIKRIERIEDGNFGDWRSVGKSVNELRMFFGAGYRVYYAHIDNTVVVLLGGSDKGDQATEIIDAQVIWADFQKSGSPEAALAAWSEEEESEEDEDET